jgi:hypothetical protein
MQHWTQRDDKIIDLAATGSLVQPRSYMPPCVTLMTLGRQG